MPWDTSDRRASLPSNWREIRERVLVRDHHTCQIQDEGCTRVASEVDHVGDRSDHRLEVLRAVCRRCHSRRTAQQGNAAKMRKRVNAMRPKERHPGLSHE